MKKLLCLGLAAVLLAATGCGATTEKPAAPAVHADYSKLTPYEPPEETYTLHKGYVAGEGLQARDDYGTLLEYCGKELAETGHSCDVLYLYGLVSKTGELITDPIYQNIRYQDGFLVLERPNPAFTNRFDTPRCFVTLAAPDGSWVRELDKCCDFQSDHGLMLAFSTDNSVDVWTAAGERKAHFDGALFEEFLHGERWDAAFEMWVYCKDDKVGYANGMHGETMYLDFETGAVSDTPPAGYPKTYEGEKYVTPPDPPHPKVEGCKWQGCFTDPVTEKNYFYGTVGDHTYYTLFDADGAVLAEPYHVVPADKPSPMTYAIYDGTYFTVESGRFCLYALADNALVFCYTMQNNGD